jgi:hypothetical protein
VAFSANDDGELAFVLHRLTREVHP